MVPLWYHAQHAIHREGDTALAFPPMPVLYPNECTYRSSLTICIKLGASFQFCKPPPPSRHSKNSLSVGFKYTWVEKNCDFRPKSSFVLETERDKPMVKMGHYSKRKSQVYSRGIRVISNDVDLTNIERRYEMGNFLIRRISLITLVCFDGE